MAPKQVPIFFPLPSSIQHLGSLRSRPDRPSPLRTWLTGWLVLFSVRWAPRTPLPYGPTLSLCVCLSSLSVPLQDIFRALVPG